MKNFKIVSMFAAIGLISCFMPITDEVVFAVEDSRNPVIDIKSPKDGDVYMSEVVVKGNVNDDSLEPGDNRGSLSSLSVLVSGTQRREGRIKIESDGTYSADTGVGQISGSNFTYNSADRSFKITIDTASYRSQSTYITITAVDRNSNESSKTIQLQPSSGPYVKLTTPSGDIYNPTADIAIVGTAANADLEGQRNKNNELSSLKLRISQLDIDTTLDIADGNTSASLVSRSGNLTYNSNSSEFNCNFSLYSNDRTSFTINIVATDKNGNETTVSRAMRPQTPNPKIYSNLSTDRSYYYSARSTTNPFYSPPPTSGASILRYSELPFGGRVVLNSGTETPNLQLGLEFSSSTQGTITKTPTFSRLDTSKTYIFEYSAATGMDHRLVENAGTVKVTLTATDVAFVTKMVWNIQEDSTLPVLSAFSATRNVAQKVITLRFKAEDAGTGIDFSTLSGTASGGTAPDSDLTFQEDGDFRSTTVSMGSITQKALEIEVRDNVGNTKSITTPVLNPISIASRRSDYNTAAFPGDVVELTVTSSQKLKPNEFSATIAGENVTVVQSAPSTTLTARVTIPSSYTTTNASVPFEITGFKDEHNIPGIILPISSTTDSSSVSFHRGTPTLTFGAVTASGGDVHNNTLYLKQNGTFSLTVSSDQPLSSTATPIVTTRPNTRAAATTTFSSDGLSLTVGSGSFSGSNDATINITIDDVQNAKGVNAGRFQRNLGHYYPGTPLENASIRLDKGVGNGATTPEVNDKVILSFDIKNSRALKNDPTVSLTLSDSTALTLVKDETVSFPKYQYTYTITAEDVASSISGANYSISVTDRAGNRGTSSGSLSPSP